MSNRKICRKHNPAASILVRMKMAFSKRVDPEVILSLRLFETILR